MARNVQNIFFLLRGVNSFLHHCIAIRVFHHILWLEDDMLQERIDLQLPGRQKKKVNGPEVAKYFFPVEGGTCIFFIGKN